MRHRRVGLIGAGLVIGALVLGGGVLTGLAWGRAGTPPTGTSAGNPTPSGPYGPGGMVGTYGPHGPYPYGAYGPCGMMGWCTPHPGAPYPGTSGTPTTGVTRVVMQGLAYQPASIRVRVGATVTWVNQDRAAHTVTFRTAGLQGSGLLQQGQAFRFTFTAPGTFAYYCAVHPSMVGTVTVTS